MAYSLKKGQVMTEFALIAPLMILFVLCLFQYGMIIKTNWLVDMAAENACRAEMVRENSHPDGQVAAQLTMIPLSSSSIIKNINLKSDNRYINWGYKYVTSILKTKTTFDHRVDRKILVCETRHSMELTIPVANHVMSKSINILNLVRDYFEGEKDKNDADYWSAITGKPHVLLVREVSLRY